MKTPSALGSTVSQVLTLLTDFAADPSFAEKFTLVFGVNVSPQQFQGLLTNLPEIVVLPDTLLQGALGAFSAETGKIYLSEGLVNGNGARLKAVVIEEIGHFIDAQVNQVDSPGDEGAILAALVQGGELADGALASLQAEDDHGFINLNGINIAIEMANITGTPGNDNLTGTNQSDTIYGGDGNDIINGGLGDDFLYGQTGNDTLSGSIGNDFLDGGDGNDTIFGADGNDTVDGGLGNDSLYGGNGRDTINGGDGDDFLDGSDGDASLVGGAGVDTLNFVGRSAGTVINYVDPNVGATSVGGAGGLGNTFIQGIENFYFFGNVSTGTDNINASGASYASLEGLAGNDILISGIGDDFLDGGSGNDTLVANAGNDFLFGGVGNDTLNGGLGNDYLDGGAGNDTYIIDSLGDTIVELSGGGTDAVRVSIDYTLGTDLENLIINGNGGNLNGTGNELNNVLIGNSGLNTLIGLAGNDTLNGGAGADTMVGGVGDDTYIVDEVGDVVTELLGEGTDTIRTSIDYILGANVENLTLLTLDETTTTINLNGTGNELSNVLTGNSGNNVLNGRAGADTITGNAGADTFVFRLGESTATALDRVTDFEIGIDKIDLLTQGGTAKNPPVAFFRAADSAATDITAIVTNVFTDANGALAGNQTLGRNRAALVVASSSTYLVINDNILGFQSANDLVINLTGITGTLPALGSIPVASFFV